MNFYERWLRRWRNAILISEADSACRPRRERGHAGFLAVTFQELESIIMPFGRW